MFYFLKVFLRIIIFLDFIFIIKACEWKENVQSMVDGQLFLKIQDFKNLI